MAGKTFVDLGSGVGQVLLLICNSSIILHYAGTLQLRVTGMHDGCSAVQSIQVYRSLFLIPQPMCYVPTLAGVLESKLWSIQRSMQCSCCLGLKPSSFLICLQLFVYVSLKFTHVQLQIPVVRKSKWRCACSSSAPARRLLEELRCQSCHRQRKSRVPEQSEIWS